MAGDSSGVVSNEDAPEAENPGAESLCFAANSAASLIEIAEAFFLGNPDLKENFWRGANDVFIFCNFSERALMA